MAPKKRKPSRTAKARGKSAVLIEYEQSDRELIRQASELDGLQSAQFVRAASLAAAREKISENSRK